MIDKFIQSKEVCSNAGYPTTLGWIILGGILIVLIIIARIIGRR
jgi:hypothetical protein